MSTYTKKNLYIRVHKPPMKWIDFAFKQGITDIYIINNSNLKYSIRIKNKIYLNVRRKNWQVYCKILDVNCFEEATTCKLLHEMGHIIYCHSFITPKSKIQKSQYDLEIALEEINIKNIFLNIEEKEAWNYAKEFKKRYTYEYIQLVRAFKKWTEEHMI